MHRLLSDLLRKRNLTQIDLSSEEKQEFHRWQAVLDQEVTVEKIQEFCRIQKELIEGKWADLDSSKLRNERLLMLHTVYGKILRLIDSTNAERKSVEEELNSLLDTD